MQKVQKNAKGAKMQKVQNANAMQRKNQNSHCITLLWQEKNRIFALFFVAFSSHYHPCNEVSLLSVVHSRYTYGGAQPGRTFYEPNYYYRPSHSVYPSPVHAPVVAGYGGAVGVGGLGGGYGAVGGGLGGGYAGGAGLGGGYGGRHSHQGYVDDGSVELRGIGGGYGGLG